jgi:hypothetical protein
MHVRMPGYLRPCVRTHARLHVYACATHARTHACRHAWECTSPACALHMHAHAAASSPDTVVCICACCLRKQMRIRSTHSAIANTSPRRKWSTQCAQQSRGDRYSQCRYSYRLYALQALATGWLSAPVDGQGCSAAALSSAGAVDFSLSGSVSARDHRERRTRGTDSLAHAHALAHVLARSALDCAHRSGPIGTSSSQHTVRCWRTLARQPFD